MPTQEERLATLEQTVAQNTKDIKKANEYITFAIGYADRASLDISGVDNKLESIQNTLEVHVDAANAHLESLQKHADKIDKDFNEVKQELAETKTLLTQILDRLPEKP
jgi:chromosome segregation ATPase